MCTCCGVVRTATAMKDSRNGGCDVVHYDGFLLTNRGHRIAYDASNYHFQ